MSWLGDLTRKALAADRTMHYGRALGLTEEQAREVLGAWIEANLNAGLEWNEHRVVASMEARAEGRDWDPRPHVKAGQGAFLAWLISRA
jgi:hypothetical protein